MLGTEISSDVIVYTMASYLIMGGSLIVLYSFKTGVAHLSTSNPIFTEGRVHSISYEYNLSVIIPVKNKAYIIPKVVEAIAESVKKVTKLSVQIIVIDDGSSDESFKILKETIEKYGKYFTDTIIMRNPISKGKLAALKQAIKVARWEFVLLLDADTVIDAEVDSIIWLLRRLKEKGVAGSTGYLEPMCKRNIICRFQEIMYLMAFSVGRRFDEYLRSPTQILSGAFSAYRKDILERVIKSIGISFAEDFELTVYIARHGRRIVYEDRARAYTEAPSSLHDFLRQQIRWYTGGMAVIAKYGREVLRGLLGRENNVWRKYSITLILRLFEEYIFPCLQVIGYMTFLVSIICSLKLMFLVFMSSFMGVVLAGTLLVIYTLIELQRLELVKYSLPFVLVFLPLLAFIKVASLLAFMVKRGRTVW